MNEEHLKRVGVKKLLESASGREYLSSLQKKYEKELIQPGDPRFLQLYGRQIEEREKEKARLEKQSRDSWVESADKKRWEAEQKKNSHDKSKLIL